MTYKILTSIIFRITGLLLFIEFLNHFENLIISILNLVIAILFVSKAEYFSNKIIKKDHVFENQLSTTNLIQSGIMLLGIYWLAKASFILPNAIQFFISMILELSGYHTLRLVPEFFTINYIIKIILAYFFIFMSRGYSPLLLSDKIMNFLKKRSSIDFIENENTPL